MQEYSNYPRSPSRLNTSVSTICAAGGGRAAGEIGGVRRSPGRAPPEDGAAETELSKLIRYGCQFELQVHQMAELTKMRAENTRLRRKVQDESAAPGAGEQPTVL